MILLGGVAFAGNRLGSRAGVATIAACVGALSLLIPERSANAIEYRIPKPGSRHQEGVDVRSPRVRGVIDQCSRVATSKGVFGDVTVTMKHDPTNPSVSGSPALGSHRGEVERCVREGLGHLARRLDLESPRAELLRWPGQFTLTIGEVRPVLPPLDILLPRWERALNATHEQRGEADTALAAVLPRGISYRHDGCLGIAWPGPAVLASLDMWARLSGRALHELWFKLPFFYLLAPNRPSGVLVLSESRLVITTPGQFPEALCLHRLIPEEVEVIRSQIDQVGTCWVGNLEEILRSPRVAFPADRAFESVSTIRGQTCALDREGAMTCCGSPLARDLSAVRWRAISVRQGGVCGVTKSGDLRCTFEESRLTHQTTLTQGNGPICVVDERGRPFCFYLSTSLPGGGSWPPVSRISSGAHGVCAISKDKQLLCSSKRPPAERDVTFSDVATSPLTDSACALKTSGALLCWSQRDGRPLSFSQDAPFAALSPVIDQEVVFGIGSDGKIVQARRTPTVGLAAGAPTQPPPDTFKAVTATDGQVCGVTTAGRVLCWGTTWPGPNRRAAPGHD